MANYTNYIAHNATSACCPCGNNFGNRGFGNPFQTRLMGQAMNAPFDFSSGNSLMMQMMQILMGLMAGQMIQQLLREGGGQQLGQFAAGMNPNFGGIGGGAPGVDAPSLRNFLGNGVGPHSPNTMSPPSSTGQISALSQNRDERIRQVVDAAKRTYPEQPHMAKLAAAQALLESGIASSRGPSGLARDHNNLFGIKGRGTSGSVNMRTREVYGGQNVSIRDGFAKNATVEDSFQQHKNLMNRPRYSRVLGARSFEQAAQEVKQAGYATDPNYSRSLISVYNQHLARYF